MCVRNEERVLTKTEDESYEYSYEEIAKELNSSKEAVRQTLLKAHRKMKKFLQYKERADGSKR